MTVHGSNDPTEPGADENIVCPWIGPLGTTTAFDKLAINERIAVRNVQCTLMSEPFLS